MIPIVPQTQPGLTRMSFYGGLHPLYLLVHRVVPYRYMNRLPRASEPILTRFRPC